ncbi:MAG: hypothetical protein AAFO06_03635 [Cyanobacteria bacterium J06597_16]
MIAIQPKTRQILGVNQQSYQALKASMSLNLRRQLLIAVCDNVAMQNQLAAQLESDLNEEFGQLSQSSTAPLSRLVFDPEDGHLPKQVAHWVRQTLSEDGTLPKLQVLGIEQMTRQPAITQNHFLRSLEKVEALLPRLNTSLLVWLPWPWLRTIQQSAPTFWNWRSGIFEFVSDPTPIRTTPDSAHPDPAHQPDDIDRPSDFEETFEELQHDDETLAGQPVAEQQPVEQTWQTQAALLDQPLVDLPVDLPLEDGLFDNDLFDNGLYGEADLSNPTPESSAIESSTIEARDVSSPASPPPQETEEEETDTHHHQASDVSYTANRPEAAITTASEYSDGPDSHRPTVTESLADDPTTITVKPAGREQRPDTTLLESILASTSVAPQETTKASSIPVEGTDADKKTVQTQSTAQHQPPAIPSAGTQSTGVENNSPPAPQNNTEKAAADNPSGQDSPNHPKPSKKRTKRRANAGIMGGLRSIVSKGVNADKSGTIQRSANSTNAQATAASSATYVAQDVTAQAAADQTQSALQSAGQTPAATSEKTPEQTPEEKTLAEQRQAEQKADRQRIDRQKAADDYFAVGMVYRTRIENGERGLEMIEPAIAAYEGALRCLSGPHPNWGSGLNDLGTLYWLKAQQVNDPQQAIDCMTHSIQLYQEAIDKLEDLNKQENADIASQLYSNMGAVYTMLAAYESPLEYLQRAAATYQLALPLYDIKRDPEEFATLQNSLGSVFWKISHYHEPAAYLHQAITAYNEAVKGYQAETQPLDYAAVQNNLGITYWSLAKHERPSVLLKYAIAAYRDALNYRTPEVDPAACAITYNNLALAYWDLAKEGAQEGTINIEQKTRYQKNAVTAFEAALSISQTAQALSSVDSAAIFHCLGDVHAQMAETASSLTEVSDYLQKSLYSYLKAIEGVPEDAPIYQNRIGAIVTNLRAHYDQLGLSGQQTALNRVPPAMLSEVMMAL